MPSSSPIRLSFTVQGMSCTSCAASIENKLSTVRGVANPSVNFAALRAEVDFNPTAYHNNTNISSSANAVEVVVSPSDLRAFHESLLITIKDMGYKVDPMHVTRRRFMVSGMTCAGCSNYLEKELSLLVGVLSVSVVFASVSADVSFLSTVTSAKEVEEKIVNSGYTVVTATAIHGRTPKASAADPAASSISVNINGEAQDDDDEFDGARVSGYIGGENDHVVSALERKEEISTYRNRFLGSLVFSAPLMVAMIAFMTHPLMPVEEAHRTLINTIYMVLATPAVVYFGRDYFIHAWKGLKRLQFTMDTLVAVGVGGAYLFSVMALVLQYFDINATCYFDTAAELITFMLLGKFLEAAAKAKTSDALVLLLKLTPPTATLVKVAEDGTEDVQIVASATLEVGDLVRVAAGDKIPVDGTVADGTSEVDEAAVTGESVPRAVATGAKVVGGTINTVSVITIKATAIGSDTVVSQIIRIVEDAQRTKPAIQRFADRIASVFVPCVLVVSSLVFLLWIALGYLDAYPTEWRKGENVYVFAFQNFLSTLVVACPCALGLATPTAIMVGTGVGAEMGVLAKSGIVLETAPTIDTFIFDKTGTITTGKMNVTAALYFHRESGEITRIAAQCEADLRVIGHVESMANHPIANAVGTFIRQELSNSPLITQTSSGQSVSYIPPVIKSVFNVVGHTVTGGKGVAAEVNGELVRVGSAAYIEETCKYMPDGAQAALQAMGEQGRTIVAASIGGSLVALLAVADQPKAEARSVVAYLISQRKRVMMVTGDNALAAQRVAAEVGILPCDVEACCMPADKERIVSREQAAGRKVAFIGDGINDSPALAQANLGIALGAGTDIAIECADAVLMHDSLSDILAFFSLSATVVRRIRLNFAWALCYNLVMVPVAAGILYPIAGQSLPPVAAGVAMICSSLSVLASSLALRCFKRPTFPTVGLNNGKVTAGQLEDITDERARLTQADVNANKHRSTGG